MPVKIGKVKAYTLEEVAGILKVNIRTLRTYINKGKLKGVKMGRQVYVAEQNLEKFLLGNGH
jgi:excisionase family DNA binding protein